MRKLSLEELGRPSPQTFRQGPRFPLCFLVDNIRSALNVGSIFRTADALGLREVVLCGISAQPPHKDLRKTAIGAEESMDWRYFSQVEQAAEVLQSEGYAIFALEQTDRSEPLPHFRPPEEGLFALALGNEVEGISGGLLPYCAGAIEIPQYGSKHSFNVAVSAGIAGWHLTQQLQPKAAE